MRRRWPLPVCYSWYHRSGYKAIRMTRMITLDEAKSGISDLLERVRNDDAEFVISDNGTLVARLAPLSTPQKNIGPRIPGMDAGKVIIGPDFDDPLPEELLRAFEGRE